ncbi:hypothetical protein [Endozoicomonas elysicola]|uniref:hypothetical protein n=1 Tax=Endozoicomonas elysicola TaxID=305900 RepID=UPI001267E850|nr:hypothetical protein [Endozoicomonas elysicola]
MRDDQEIPQRAESEPGAVGGSDSTADALSPEMDDLAKWDLEIKAALRLKAPAMVKTLKVVEYEITKRISDASELSDEAFDRCFELMGKIEGIRTELKLEDSVDDECRYIENLIFQYRKFDCARNKVADIIKGLDETRMTELFRLVGVENSNRDKKVTASRIVDRWTILNNGVSIEALARINWALANQVSIARQNRPLNNENLAFLLHILVNHQDFVPQSRQCISNQLRSKSISDITRRLSHEQGRLNHEYYQLMNTYDSRIHHELTRMRTRENGRNELIDAFITLKIDMHANADRHDQRRGQGMNDTDDLVVLDEFMSLSPGTHCVDCFENKPLREGDHLHQTRTGNCYLIACINSLNSVPWGNAALAGSVTRDIREPRVVNIRFPKEKRATRMEDTVYETIAEVNQGHKILHFNAKRLSHSIQQVRNNRLGSRGLHCINDTSGGLPFNIFKNYTDFATRVKLRHLHPLTPENMEKLKRFTRYCADNQVAATLAIERRDRSGAHAISLVMHNGKPSLLNTNGQYRMPSGYSGFYEITLAAENQQRLNAVHAKVQDIFGQAL